MTVDDIFISMRMPRQIVSDEELDAEALYNTFCKERSIEPPGLVYSKDTKDERHCNTATDTCKDS